MLPSFSVYNASAGSGKTYTLAKEYLKILLLSPSYDSFSSILAITFTNKAVGEMKKRILDYLIAFSEERIEEDTESFLKDIVQETGLSEEKVFKKSKIVLKTLLQNYANFDISTIDKFTLKLVKSFAFDLGIHAQFDVSLDENYLQEQAIDLLISQTGEDEEITKILIEYAKAQVLEDGQWDLTLDIKNVAKLLEKETFRTQLKKIKDKSLEEIIEVKNNLIQENIKLKKEILESAKTIEQLLATTNFTESDFSNKTFPNYLKRILNHDYSKVEIVSIDDIKINKKSKYTIEDLPVGIDNLLKIIYKDVHLIIFNQEIIKNLTPLSLLNKVVSKISEIENNQNILLLSKFNELIYNEIISQPALYIYERIGERYKHFFIDEFQDTSQLQWFNLIPLIDNSISSESNGVKGSVMVVGDPKQSIYRFRGGKPELLIELSKTNDSDDAKQNPFNTKDKIVINLDTNYRSYSEVIDFNNQFFKFIAQEFYQEDYKNLYLNSSQNKNQKQGGCVSITFASNESIDTDEALENNDLMIEHVLQKIKSCKSNGFDYGEMAVLIRKNEQGVWIAKRLIQEGIKVISAESLLLSSSSEVLTVFYFLQLIQYQNDETILSQFIYNLYSINTNLKSSEKTIFQITKEAIDFCKNDSLENWLHNYNISIDLESIKSKPLYNSVQEIIDVLLQKPKNNSYIQTLLEIIWEKSIKSKMNLQELLDFWERKKDKLSIAASTTADAVVILSIHKSKGLEFPVVIYPFANQKINSHVNSVFLPIENQSIEYSLVSTKSSSNSKLANVNESVNEIFKELEEENKMDIINNLYVALTRAKEQMHIISTPKINKNGTISQSYISKYFLEFLVFNHIYEENKLDYIFGTLERKSIPKKMNNFAIPINNILNRLNFNQINIAKSEALLWQTKQKEAIEYGDFIHHLMQEINTIKDVEKTLNKAIENGKINPNDLQEVKETILKIVTHKDLNNYFNEKAIIYNEQKIIIPRQKMVIPDRIVLYQDKLYILDYKTGKKENKHLDQILQYKEILIKMNFNVAQCVLVYINNDIEVAIADNYIT